jgi:hypothetical protein
MKEIKGINIKVSEESLAKAKEELNREIKILEQIESERKHYLGDVKWVLYQTICDLNDDQFTFICGKYAMSKIRSMQGFEENKATPYCGILDLNGESIEVYCLDNLDKKEILIVNGYLEEDELCNNKYKELIRTKLYFA